MWIESRFRRASQRRGREGDAKRCVARGAGGRGGGESGSSGHRAARGAEKIPERTGRSRSRIRKAAFVSQSIATTPATILAEERGRVRRGFPELPHLEFDRRHSPRARLRDAGCAAVQPQGESHRHLRWMAGIMCQRGRRRSTASSLRDRVLRRRRLRPCATSTRRACERVSILRERRRNVAAERARSRSAPLRAAENAGARRSPQARRSIAKR